MKMDQNFLTGGIPYDGFVYPKTSLKQFFSKYEMILENRYKEWQADEESSHRTPLTVTKFYMEEQLAKAYTINMFRKFQDELKATMYCDGMPIKVDGRLVTFEVKECSYMFRRMLFNWVLIDYTSESPGSTGREHNTRRHMPLLLFSLLYSPSCIRAQYSSKLLPIITQGDSDRCNRDRGSLGVVLLARLHGVKRRSGCIHGGGEGGGDKQERGANHGGRGLRDATAAAGVAHGGGGGGSRE
ncbi:uncharacterized protein LOC105914272 isoform X2 [Setaria italica]|uniref:uncharacterized protein LOC105914272 isoform X2 n=1 Tax=Setaria italica TaxID=4555 RepID=UPI000BE5A19E|nr:uncharacterized protein LOC105914272 isoform X2 [Setaria italica]